jgi:hypothetical protein
MDHDLFMDEEGGPSDDDFDGAWTSPRVLVAEAWVQLQVAERAAAGLAERVGFVEVRRGDFYWIGGSGRLQRVEPGDGDGVDA